MLDNKNHSIMFLEILSYIVEVQIMKEALEILKNKLDHGDFVTL